MTNTATGRSRAWLRLRSLVLLFAAGLLLALGVGAPPAQAQAADDDATLRTHDISWGHPAPASVERFVVLASPTQRPEDARRIDVGKPQGVAAPGLTVFSARVAFAPDELISIVAVDASGLESPPSSWSGMPPTRPGQPLIADR